MCVFLCPVLGVWELEGIGQRVNLHRELCHVAVDLAVGDAGIDLCGLDIGVSEHFGDGLNRHSVVEGNGGCKGMPGHMEGYVLVDIAEGCDLFEVIVAFLVGVNGEYQVTFPERLVLLDEPEWDFQQGNMHWNFGLGALGDDPKPAIRFPDEVVRGEGLDIDVGESGVAAEEEDVPHALQTLRGEFLVGHALQLIDGEVGPLRLVLVEFEQVEGIPANPAVIPRHLINGRELVHEVDGRVVADLVGAAIPNIKAVEEPFCNVVEGEVFDPQLIMDEFLHPVLADLVADKGLFAVAIGFDYFSIFLDEFVEEFHRGLDGPFLCGADLVFDFESRDGFSSGLEVVVVPLGGSANLRKDGVDTFLFSGAAIGAASLGIPMVGDNALLSGEMCHFSVDDDSGDDGCLTIGLDLTLLHDEGDFECCFHLSYF